MRWTALLALAVVAVAGAGAPAEAEFALDVYAGAAWTQSADVRVGGRDDTGNTVDATIFDIKSTTGVAAGLRAGYWIDPLPFVGFGIDFFFFTVPIPAQTASATGTLSSEIFGKPISIDAAGEARVPAVTLPALGFSPDLRLRWPIFTSKAYPQGILQPYVTAGPAWALTLNSDQVGVRLGGKIGAGLSVTLVRWVALFAEYRYTFFPGFAFSHEHVGYKTDINNHAAVFGVSLRF
jgi:Outer membrane protein beta-barrel domain